MSLKFADFCAGIGGFRLGLEHLGWECVYSCEIDGKCEKTYGANFGTKFDKGNILETEADKLPYFEILAAGFPCQPFSIAGKQLGFDDPRARVLPKILEVIKIAKPTIVILENVANFVSHSSGTTFRLLLKKLNEAGYDVHSEILDSAYFGVPQHRKRVFIIAFRKELNSLFFSITKKREKPLPFRNYLAKGDFSIPITEKWQKYIDYYTEKISWAEIGFDVPKTRLVIERANFGVQLEDCILQMRSSGIRACSLDAPLPTFAVSHSGGGAMIPVYTGERRHLNLTEMRRLMGFPDSFNLEVVSRTDAIKQLSNAVCPAVVNSIGQDIENFLSLGAARQSELVVQTAS